MHSKGPWKIERNVIGEIALFTQDYDHLTSGESDLDLKTREDNARLMAAAPTMLKGIRAAIHHIQRRNFSTAMHCLIEAITEINDIQPEK